MKLRRVLSAASGLGAERVLAACSMTNPQAQQAG